MSQYILLLLTITCVVSLFAYWRGYLTWQAAILAAIFASTIVIFSGVAIGLSVGVCFYITCRISNLPLLLRKNSHNDVNVSAPFDSTAPRDTKQILANGLLLTTLALLNWNWGELPLALTAAILGCIAAVAGDTWASEAASMAKQQPRILLTGEWVKEGTPGAVTSFGIFLTGLSGLIAALVFILGTFAPFDFPHQYDLTFTNSVILILSAIIGGILGALADSIAGAHIQAHYRTVEGNISDSPIDINGSTNQYIKGSLWLSNNLVNFVNSVVGAVSAWIVCTLMVNIFSI